MNHVIHAARRRLHVGELSDASAAKLDLARGAAEVFLFARRKIVEHHHAMPPAQQFIHNIRADKSGAARHQVAHGVTIHEAEIRDQFRGVLRGFQKLWPAPYNSSTLEYSPSLKERATCSKKAISIPSTRIRCC